MSNIHIGIDLGTTNTVMASCKMPRTKGFPRPRVVQINQYVTSTQMGIESSIPSVLFFDSDGKVKVGRYARDRKNTGADRRILYNTKIDIGKEVEYDNGYTPVKAATEILKCCYNTILQEVIPKGDEFPEVTITVPASFNQNQIADTRTAAKLAGFDIEKVSILEEPLAALFHYINEQSISGEGDGVDFSEKKRVLVYDIGGGTCDVCVVDLQIDENGIYDPHFVLTNRYTELGGNDFDEQAAIGLLNKLFEKYNISEKEIGSAEIKNDLVAKILPSCEQYKIIYSNQLQQGYKRDEIQNAVFSSLRNFLDIAENVELELTYAEYELYTKIFFDDSYCRPTRDLTDKMREKNILRPVYKLLKRLEENNEPGIDCVFLTGGMSKYLPIEETLAKFCKCPIIKSEEPMESVAKGAAISKFIKLNQYKNAPTLDSTEENNQTDLPDSKDERPRLPEAIFIDIENQLPLKIIDANIAIPCKGEVEHEFHVGANGVRFHLFAGQSQWDAEMRILYDYSQKFNSLVKPNTVAHIRYAIDEDRFLKLELVLDDDRKQTFSLTADTVQN